MLRETPVRRVIVVVLDGLRPDAIPRFQLPNLTALVQRSAYTMLGRTVTPSVTACAMASLLTGADPMRHGLRSDRFHLPRSSGPLDATIPLFIAGGAVRPGELAPGASLLDVPATVCYALGIARPESFAGRPLTSAFARRSLVAAA